MATKNDITGDSLISRGLSKEGEANWDLIFPPKKKKTDDWDETRIDTIGQNGNDGEHYGKDTTT